MARRVSVTGWRKRSALLLIASTMLLLFARPSVAADPNEDAQAVLAGLTSLADKAGELADDDLLARAVALTGLDPTSADGLDMDSLLADLMDALPGDFDTYDPLTSGGRSQIQSALEGLDTTDLAGTGIAVEVGPVVVTGAGATDPVDLTIPVTATRSVPVPLALSTDVVQLDGGSLTIDLTLTANLPFRYRPDLRLTSPHLAMSLRSSPAAPSVSLSAALSGSPSVSAHLGFTDVTAAITGLTGSVDFGVTLDDPDTDGLITLDEWTNTTIGDLTTTTRGGSISGDLTLDSDLVAASPDVTVPFSHTFTSLPSGDFTFPAINAAALNPFTNITPEEVIASFGQAATAISGAQQFADVDLPFLKDGMAKAAKIAQPLFDFVDQQSVICGTSGEGGTSPTGDVSKLAIGDEVFCQAFASEAPNAGSIVWTVPGGIATAVENTSGAAADGTIGPLPNKYAKFMMDTAGAFDVSADYSVTSSGGTVVKTTERPAQTAQELVLKLASLGGFDDQAALAVDTLDALDYDSTTKALRFHLRKSFAGDTATYGYDFGDQLEASTGVVGLEVDGDTSVNVSASDIGIDLTIGVLLVDDVAVVDPGSGVCLDPAGTACSSELDRIFVEVDPSAPEMHIGDGAFAATAPTLRGTLGFLEVTASGQSTTGCAGGASFCVTKRTGDTSPLVAVDLQPRAGGFSVDGTTVPNGILLRDLLFNPLDRVASPDINLSMHGGLRVAASVSGTELGSGTATIAWDDITVGTPTVSADSDLLTELKSLDLQPNVFGNHTGTTAASVMTDTSKTFTVDELVGKRIENLTDGSSCEIASNTATSVTCSTTTDSETSASVTLAGGDANQWESGDRYRVQVGDPLALLWLLLDNIDMIVTQVDSISGGGAGAAFEKDLPLVGLSPKDVVGEVRSIRRAVDELRGGPGPSIACGTQTEDGDGAPITLTAAEKLSTVPPSGDPSQLGGAATIYCSATNAKPASDITWEAVQGATASTNTSGTDANGTIGQPASKNAAFSVTAPGNIRSDANPTGYHIRARFTDADGEHTVDFPEQSVPSTLQKFETALEERLGLGPDLLTLKLENVDVGGTSTLALTAKLSYGLCSGFTGDSGFCTGITAGGTPNVDPIAQPLNLQLGSSLGLGDGDLVGVGADGDVEVAFAMLATLGLAFPVTAPTPRVLDETGIEFKGRAGATNIDLRANLGPLALRAGTSGNPAGGKGELKLGANFDLGDPGAVSGTPKAKSFADFFSSITGEFDEAGDQSCGDDTFTHPDFNSGDPGSLEGFACGVLSLGEGPDGDVEHFGDLGIVLTGLADDGDFTLTPYVPAGLATAFADRILSWDMLLRALPYLLEKLETGLSAAASGGTPGGNKIPIIGDALDAGADVVGTVRTDVIPLVEQAGQFIDDQIAALEAQFAADGECVDSDGTDTPCLPPNTCYNEPPEGEEPEEVECAPEEACLDSNGDPAACPEPKKADPPAVAGIIQDFLWQHLGDPGVGLVRENLQNAGAKEDIVVTTKCGGDTDCTTTNKLWDITDVRVTMNVGQGVDTPTGGVPFDVGLDGVPLRIAGAIDAHAGWNLLVDLGLSRESGPYLVAADPDRGTQPADQREIRVSGLVQLDSEPTSGAICGSEIADPVGGAIATAIPTFTASADRCLTGKIGFIAANLRDAAGEADRTKVSIETYLDLQKKSDPTGSTSPTGLVKITFTDLVAGELKPVLGLDITAKINLRFRTGLPSGVVAGFPSVVGTFHLDWSFARNVGGTPDAGPSTPTVGFADIHLDASEFVEKYLNQVTSEIRRITGPFKPVIDVVSAPIPVVSDLAALVGADPVTLLSLMEAIGGNNLTVIKAIAAFIKFVNDPVVASGLIPLGALSDAGGSFSIDAAKAKAAKGPGEAGQLVTNAQKFAGSLLSRPPKSGTGTGATNTMVTRSTHSGAGVTRDNLPGTFGVPGLTFPFMGDAGQIFGFIMGQDVTLIRMDFGTLRATAGFSYNFGPFFVGPVPITAGVGGSVTLEGRFVLGYDTSGIRKVLSGGSGVHLFDGIFIDDLDHNGVDVPEISLIGEVYAQAGVSVFIATAGIKGGIRLTVDLNLADGPVMDGKLRIEEVFNKLSNPICLFDVSGRLEAFLRAFLEINYFIGSKTWEFELLSIELLNFSFGCAPPKPVLAVKNGDVLTLNMGSEARRNARRVSTEVVDEKFVVRPVDATGKYSVSAFGIYQVYSGINKIYADAGDGADTIQLEPGSNEEDTTVPPIPFAANAFLIGGSGNDMLKSGDGTDILVGGTGNDDLDGGAGDDLLVANSFLAPGSDDGTNNVKGGPGQDVLIGSAGGDRLSGGPGADYLDGNAGEDFLNGGPGANPADAAAAASSHDLPDVLVGGAGNDNIEGGWGNDVVYGDVNQNAHGAGGHAVHSGLLSRLNHLQGGAQTLGTPGSIGPITGLVPAAADPGAACSNGDTSSAGDDVVDGGEGDDFLYGGPGKDRIVGGPGHDTLCGNAGNDTLDGDNPSLEASGGGNDVLDGGADHDVVRGRSGHDIVRGAGGDDLLDGGVGNDDLIGGVGRDVIKGGSGLDIAVGDNGTIGGEGGTTSAQRDTRATLTRTQRKDLVAETTGGAADSGPATGHCTYNDASGQEDNRDRSSGGTTTTADCILGGDDADVAFGGLGNDRMNGDAADDYLDGGDGDDLMRGGTGNDLMFGRSAHDEMHGDSGNDDMYGNAGNDVMRGGIGDDYVEGNSGADEMNGDADNDMVIGGSSTAGADDADVDLGGALGLIGDRVLGSAGTDVMAGDNAQINALVAGSDVIARTTPRAVTLLDVATVANDAPANVSGKDVMDGGTDADRMWGQGGTDTMSGGDGADLIQGNADADIIHGSAAADVLVGGTTQHASLKEASTNATVTFAVARDGGDTIDGDDADDIIFGDNVDVNDDATANVMFPNAAGFPVNADDLTFGDDVVHGNAGDDRIWGQLGDDELHGDAGHDHLLGDQGSVSPPTSGAVQWPEGAPRYTVLLFEPDNGGEDRVFGGTENDHAYGGANVDHIEGGLGDDHLEGNGGADVIYGLSETFETTPTAAELSAALLDGDEDDIIGGSSDVHPTAETTGARDVGDHLVGNADADVMIGDNGEIRPEVDGPDWAQDEITGGRARTVVLYDRARTEADALMLSEVSGADTMFGNGDNDRMYGQGGGDHMRGGDNQDYLEGSQGVDWIEGNDHDDDLIGGSSFESASAIGDPDDGDIIHGGAGQDVIAGDNARIVRTTRICPSPATTRTSCYFTTSGRFVGFSVDRWVTLLDLAPNPATTLHGADVISGGAGDDVAFGQDSNDWMSGGSDTDYLEGNGGSDAIFGDRLLSDVDDLTKVIDRGGVPEVPAALIALQTTLTDDFEIGPSTDDEREGAQVGPGQDDIIGGSSRAGHRDTSDLLYGDGAEDFMIGDNGDIIRYIDEGQYVTYVRARNDDRIARNVIRHDVAATSGSGVWGDDHMEGNAGDDAMWGQDGNDEMWGQDGDDDMFGELGNDAMFGGDGEDAIVGDRGSVVNTLITEDIANGSGPLASFHLSYNMPPFLDFDAFQIGSMDRRVDLKRGMPGSVGGPLPGESARLLTSDGVTTGGDDTMRGGRDHDVMHGAAGDDIMNGDSDGDILFGGNGGDVMWGGRGHASTECDPDPITGVRPTVCAAVDDRGAGDEYVDHLFGGYGGAANTPTGEFTGGSDIMDFRPRPEDPTSWLAAVSPYDDVDGLEQEALYQHHHGVDWMFGGWDRDVMQANTAGAGPNDGDRLIDWNGTFNLYTHCEADYGGYNDVRAPSPAMIDFLERLAYASGVGDTLSEVQSSSTSAFNELAMIYKKDTKSNSGKAYPNTPGHFLDTSCDELG